ncbi:MAG TPA: cytochrome c biogenesis protein CcsA [Blastocatellia bacterium]|nr:cytochrome c biogenesis protein CcsA [Blastocatellia bacterium]
MSTALKGTEAVLPELELSVPDKVLGLWPVVTPIVAAVVLILLRAEVGPRGFLYEGALTMLALISYMTASAILVTNLFVKENVLRRFGLITVMAGYCFNLSGWMIRWIEAGEAEGWKEGINGVWRYFPLDNLYPLTLGFCAGAALTTLVIIRKPKYQFLGALSMPIATVILTMATFLGNDIRTLPPILDSYWRPIHVSIATIGYGVCLVSFGLAFAYLLKDGVRSEAIAIAVILFGLLVYSTIGGPFGRFSVPFHQEYAVSLVMGKSPLPIRAELPWMAPLLLIALLGLLAALALFMIDWFKRDEKANKLAWYLFRGTAVLQAGILIVLFYQIKTVGNVISKIPQWQMTGFGEWLAKEMGGDVPPIGADRLAQSWLTENGSRLSVTMNSSPIDFGAQIGLFVALLLVAIFAWKRDEVVKTMPSLQTIDSLLYRTVGVAFPLLCMLLITGAVWANESWGRYWGWDSKEVGALVAAVAYAGFLHTRIAHGWRGRRSAYFALLGFALVIFTWLGVSFLLPGLHSYA